MITSLHFGLASRTVRAVWAVALLALATTCLVARVRRMSLHEIRDEADLVLVGRITGRQARLGPEGKMVWTDYRVQVEEVLKGAGRPGLRTLSFAGGETALKSVGVTGVPTLETGRRYVFFLLADEAPWASPTVGWGQGVFEIVPRRSPQEPEVLVSHDGEPLEMTPEGLRRGERVRRNGEWIEVPEVASRPTAGGTADAAREGDPVVLDADGNEVEQPLQSVQAKAVQLEQRSFASLDELRRFVRGESE